MTRPVVSAVLLCAAVPLLGQTPASQAVTPPTRRLAGASQGSQTGSILGIVADSLHGGPLVEAIVTVVQLPRRSVMTSVSGAFRLDSLLPGRYTLDIQHPLIDSLGIRVVSDTLVVAAGETHTVALSVPPPSRIVAIVCSPLQRQLGPAAVVGQVLDADSDKPDSGAELSMAWVETSANSQIGVRSVPQVRKTKAAADGTFRLCGLPSTVSASIQASLGSMRTGEIGVELTDEPLVFRVLRLPSTVSAVDSQLPSLPKPATEAKAAAAPLYLQTGRAVITGVVTNRRGVPIVGARVMIQGSAASAESGKDGTFTMTGAPAGTQLLLARGVGYDPVQTSLDITSRGPNRAAIQLGDFHTQLAAVNVHTKAPPSALDQTGFTRRQKNGMGHYITEDDIDREQPTYTSDLLRRIPGLYVFGSGHGASISTTRGGSCVQYLIDHNSIDPSDGQSLDELVNPADIVGIEFYQVSEIPAQLMTAKNSGCALLVVWTRQQLKAPSH